MLIVEIIITATCKTNMWHVILVFEFLFGEKEATFGQKFGIFGLIFH